MKTMKILGLIVIVMAIGFTMTSCEDPCENGCSYRWTPTAGNEPEMFIIGEESGSCKDCGKKSDPETRKAIFPGVFGKYDAIGIANQSVTISRDLFRIERTGGTASYFNVVISDWELAAPADVPDSYEAGYKLTGTVTAAGNFNTGGANTVRFFLTADGKGLRIRWQNGSLSEASYTRP